MGIAEENVTDQSGDELLKEIAEGLTEIEGRRLDCDFNRLKDFFPDVIPKLAFIDCTFVSNVSFLHLNMLGINFISCVFEDFAAFENSSIESCFFHECQFKKHASFSESIFKVRATFSDVKFTTASFSLAVFKKKALFYNCDVSEYLQLANISCSNSELILNRMPVAFITFSPSQSEGFSVEDIDWPSLEQIKQAGVVTESMCRAWKVRLRNMGDEWTASEWHLFEKELALERLSTGSNKVSYFFLACYGWVSRYGESPERASKVLAALIIAPFVFALIHMRPEIKLNEEWASYALGFIPLLSKASVSLNLSVFEKCGQIVWQGFLAIQSSLLALAVRNKVRR
ncbi:hypothetical protein ACQ0P8_06530 [Halodesulfovibrio aestuarii]|uniref:Pentapeptide repeat-containing protein n=1 Tax=Halodesulfovibrio aestuarii TaxID=126333 RepID=A0A8G2CCA6_9BACT|nr:hypothetical protein [Halodesulfovibrio aestuarii]SHJ76206.1 hypothetical protein SAMN05660830_03165 [Halodesulfovibrio aestuarii]